ncbi:MAG: tetratricopeptide repeat protein [Geobacteraceae bacterium]|nr:tetratricopeptide repeat protein [Geobacteraceae bacterium]
MSNALETYTLEISRNPENIDAYLRLGHVHHEMGQHAAAVDIYDRAIAQGLCTGALYHNRGNSLLELGRWEEAIGSYRQALRLMPNFAESYVTIATALQSLRKPYEAMASCHRALAVDPNCAEAHWNLALALLQVGEFAQGWQEFEWRWKKQGFTSRLRTFLQPLWDGAPLGNRTILIHAEQGFGDTFQFARYLPLLAAQGGTVIVECPASQKTVLAGVPGVSCCVATAEELPDFDCHLPVMSLPWLFQTRLETIPLALPYILPSLEALTSWTEKFTATDTFRVGLVWAGRKKPDPNRTCSFENFVTLAEISGVTFYSLQLENEMSGPLEARQGLCLIDHTAEIRDFCDTAALIANLDLVISIDTGVAHLAGALGKETWVLLPYAADWRWMLNRDDSPWYPAMRLFRQENAGDWQLVIASVKEAMISRVRKYHEERGSRSPDLKSAYVEGLSLLQSGKVDRAEIPLVRAFLLNPHIPEVLNAIGVLCREKGMQHEALRFFQDAVAYDPEYADCHINLGNVYFSDDRLGEAERAYRNALLVSPEDARAHQNLGVALQALGRLSEAEASFRAALKIDPGYKTARWNLAVLYLMTGNLVEGFQEFEARFSKNEPVPVLHADRPLWDGFSFAGKTLLVHAEQGFGDTFQFVRYLPLVAERGGKVLLECQHESLRDILTASLRGTAFVYVRGETLPEVHLQVSLLTLPRIFGTTLETIPASLPYLEPLAKDLGTWRERLRADSGFRIGLVWAGRPKPDPKRSASLQSLAPLAFVPGTIFYSLQVGSESQQAQDPPSGMVLRDHTAQLTDFSATAAHLANLDLVITIDSAVAHLAGALGKPVWVLLPYAADWRWMTGRIDSPWYPGMRLFRQERPGDWSIPVSSMVELLSTIPAGNGVC